MTLRVLPEAEDELAEAAQRYDCEEPGLGFEFLTAVGEAIAMISAHPERLPRRAGKLAACGYESGKYKNTVFGNGVSHAVRMPAARIARPPQLLQVFRAWYVPWAS